MSTDAVTLAQLEAFMAVRGRRTLAFPPPIEEQFERDTSPRRCQRLTTGILVSVIVYNTFLVADWLLVPDVFWRAVAIHLGLVTPWMLIATWLISRQPARMAREYLAASLPIAMFLQIDYGFATTASEYAAHYQYVIIPLLLYTNVSVHRLVFPLARVVTTAIVLCHSALVLAVGLPAPVTSMILVQLVACAYITLVANYQMERDLRKAYLYSLRERLRHAQADAASRRDALTGLANRHHLHTALERLWNRPAEEVSPVSVVLADIDHFKSLNDRYGHATGDLCLKRVAALVTAELRGSQDLAVRFGGEEVLLLFPRMQLTDAMQVAEKIRKAIETAGIPNEGTGSRGVVTASFGVATAAVDDLSAVELIAASDNALYAAKRRGRNQVWPPLAEARADDGPKATVAILPHRQRA
jgi:diguanylate cyclase (GGDEF)-like protein